MPSAPPPGARREPSPSPAPPRRRRSQAERYDGLLRRSRAIRRQQPPERPERRTPLGPLAEAPTPPRGPALAPLPKALARPPLLRSPGHGPPVEPQPLLREEQSHRRPTDPRPDPNRPPTPLRSHPLPPPQRPALRQSLPSRRAAAQSSQPSHRPR